MSVLAADVEVALVRAAQMSALETYEALDALAAAMDVFALDENSSPERCEVVARGLRTVLPRETTAALVDGAVSPAEIGARFFRLKQLAQLAVAVQGPRTE